MGAGFHVLLNDPTVLGSRTGEVARVVAKAFGQPVADVSQRVRYGGGIVAREVAEEKAREIAAKLGEVQIPTIVVPSAAIEPLPRARRIAGIVIEADGVRTVVRGSTKGGETIPWARVRSFHVNALARALSPAEVEEGRKPRALADVENASDEVRKLSAEIDYWEDREKTHRIDLCIDLIADDPVLVGRMTADEADYSALEGKKQGALENFFRLVRALLAKAPRSLIVPPTTRAFAATADWESCLFDKPEQRDAFNLWLLSAVRHGTPFGLDGAEEVDDAEVDEDDEDEADDVDETEVDETEVDEAEVDEAEDDDEDDDESREENLKAAEAAGGDAALASELELFDKTRKLRKKDVLDALEAAKGIDPGVLETDPGDKPPSNDPDMQIFKEKTGRWDVSELMKESKELEDKDL
ncbi:MAG: hypothetical protein ACAI25_10915 [Planctomycetota bacterium]